MTDNMVVIGAREHNLKNIDVTIPRNALVVITGLSGSGKSSLAFDTLYAEGQRRYIETFSSYARQFLGRMERPDVDVIEGLSPVIAIEQKTTNRNPRSTVGTVTEVYDFLRLLYARTSTAYSMTTGQAMVSDTEEGIQEKILQRFSGKRIAIMSSIVKGRKGHYRERFETLAKQGYLRARVDGVWIEITQHLKLDRYKTHDIDVVIDRLTPSLEVSDRLKQSIATAMKMGKGSILIVDYANQEATSHFSRHLMCPESGLAYQEAEPNSFSFNSPKGACPRCHGLGRLKSVDEQLIIHNPRLSLKEGALKPLGTFNKSWIWQQMDLISQRFGFDLNDSWQSLPLEAKNAILHGCNEQFTSDNKVVGIKRRLTIAFEGLVAFIESQHKDSNSKKLERWADAFMVEGACPDCKGQRLKEESLHFKIDDKNIAEVASMSLDELQQWIRGLGNKLSSNRQAIGEEILKELSTRLSFLIDVGLHYLNLNRSAKSLSGGEAQRIRLATQIGSELMHVLYILDEPSIGLHPRDNDRLIKSLESLRDMGNSVIVVEHDEDLMRAANHIIDLGPRAGLHGGHVVAEGNYEAICASDGLTGLYLSGRKSVHLPANRRQVTDQYLEVLGATGNNLCSVDVKIPLGCLTVVTGVSGSGKSTLINQTLLPAFAGPLQGLLREPATHKGIKGLDLIDKVIDVDQSPIGRSPRSNPATYTGLFNEIRKLFSQLPEAKIRGYKPGRFSFNVKGGRCETCEGGGNKVIEMNFLPDVHVPCEVCHGKRFNRETLEVRYKGHSIGDVLEMPVEEAKPFFKAIPKIHDILSTLMDVGLSYLTLGQSSTTLSGGEAQRIKLASELSKRDTGNTLYILDEPTTGLHFEDIEVLMGVIQQLVDRGNTVIIIEHQLDVIAQADHVIDLGPEGGKGGGKVIAIGSPEVIAINKGSMTGEFLSKHLKKRALSSF
ncbi:MAG: excinuclease ABC subunit UvrA [Flavobacteriales bacterium]|nr:excinuclease ABC subunit UvrA [Flavobacteriales bacterium]